MCDPKPNCVFDASAPAQPATCLVCSKKINNNNTDSSKECRNSDRVSILNGIASIFHVSRSIYQNINCESLPQPIICSTCQDSIDSVAKLDEAVAALELQKNRIVRTIKNDLRRSFTRNPEIEQLPDDQVSLNKLRRTYGQCLSTCEVNLTACKSTVNVSSNGTAITQVSSPTEADRIDIKSENESDEIDIKSETESDENHLETEMNTTKMTSSSRTNRKFANEKKSDTPQRSFQCVRCGQNFKLLVALRCHLKKNIVCSVATLSQAVLRNSRSKISRKEATTGVRKSSRQSKRKLKPSTKTLSVPGLHEEEMVDNVESDVLPERAFTEPINDVNYNSPNEACGKTRDKSNDDSDLDYEPLPSSSTGEVASRNKKKTKTLVAAKSSRVPAQEKCDLCGKTVLACRLQDHLKLHNGTPNFPCTECPVQLNSVESLTKHKKRFHNASKSLIFRCRKNTCPKEFKTYAELYEHRKTEHYIMGEAHLAKSGNNLFKCNLCTAVYGMRKQLGYHKRLHAGETRFFKCNFCTEVFETSARAKIHMRKKHQDQIKDQYPCELCGDKFPDFVRLEAHLELHNGEKDFPCKHCPARFQEINTLNFHLISHGQLEMTYRCRICSKTFPSFKHLNDHKKDDHNLLINSVIKEKRFKCTICDKDFANKARLKTHIDRHNGDNDNSSDRNMCCEICGSLFRTRNAWRKHQQWHAEGCPSTTYIYRCNFCSEIFNHKFMYEFHVKKHVDPQGVIASHISLSASNRAISSFECKACSKMFGVNENNEFKFKCQHPKCSCGTVFTNVQTFLFHHQSICKPVDYPAYESNANNIPCQDCGRTFADDSRLADHVRRCHPTTDKFTCWLCGKIFGLRSILNKHVKTHSQDRNFSCDQCSHKSKTKSNLLYHITACHTSERKYSCETCGKSFKFIHDLKKHGKTHLTNTTVCTTTGVRSNNGRVPREETAQFQCRFCCKTFSSEEDIQLHIAMTHVTLQDDSSNDQSQDGVTQDGDMVAAEELNLAEFDDDDGITVTVLDSDQFVVFELVQS